MALPPSGPAEDTPLLGVPSLSRFRTIFEIAPVGIILGTAEARFLDVNPTMCRMLGYTYEEFMRLSAPDIMAPESLAMLGPALRELNSGEQHAGEWTYRRKDGSPITVEVIAAKFPDGTLLALVRDVSERREIEARLTEQAALLDSANDAIIARDMEHRITYWNRAAERLYGYTADEAIGQPLQELLRVDSERFDASVRVALEKGEWKGETYKTSKDGTRLTIFGSWTLMRDAAGAPTAILTIDADITERKRLEQQFLRAQRMESIGTLAGGIAHDLNNVLAPILLAIELLRVDETAPERLDLLDRLSDSTRHGAELVRQVLSFARGDEGRPTRIQLGPLIRNVQQILRDTFPKNIDIRVHEAEELWPVVADATQLHQVLTNLCVNARDAMPSGGVLTITIANRLVDETYAAVNAGAQPGPHVLIKVEDTGSGIPAGLLARIFDPFFTTKEIGKGTGLGLSTVATIVKSHGGFINVYSELGRGTKFKVLIPTSLDAAELEPTRTDASEVPTGHGELILIVDDEQTIRTVAKRVLENFGYRVLLAAHGAEAVAIFAKSSSEIALVLTDMAMPVMDGPATILALKSIDPTVKIIASSGHAFNEGVARAVGAGVEHFVPKPYAAETLLRVIGEALRG